MSNPHPSTSILSAPQSSCDPTCCTCWCPSNLHRLSGIVCLHTALSKPGGKQASGPSGLCPRVLVTNPRLRDVVAAGRGPAVDYTAFPA